MAPSNSVVMCNSESQWETLEAEVVEYVSKGRVLICGDLNARTGEGKDFIDNDAPVPIDFHAYLPDKELPRVSKDKYTNYQGRQLLDMCLSSGLRIVNGRLKGDVQGNYTCYTPRGCSVVDYLIVSNTILEKVVKFCIEDLPIASDHCPLNFTIKLMKMPPVERCSYEIFPLAKPLHWDEHTSINFSRALAKEKMVPGCQRNTRCYYKTFKRRIQIPNQKV